MMRTTVNGSSGLGVAETVMVTLPAGAGWTGDIVSWTGMSGGGGF